MSYLSLQPEPADTPDAKRLLAALDDCLNPLYAPQNRFGLSVAALQDESVVFLVARSEGAAVGCGAVKFFEEYAEVKRMYVTSEYRGRGVAQALLTHLEALAQEKGFRVLRLETGVHQEAAQRLYERSGFSRCLALGDYEENGVNLCYEKRIVPGSGASEA